MSFVDTGKLLELLSEGDTRIGDVMFKVVFHTLYILQFLIYSAREGLNKRSTGNGENTQKSAK